MYPARGDHAPAHQRLPTRTNQDKSGREGGISKWRSLSIPLHARGHEIMAWPAQLRTHGLDDHTETWESRSQMPGCTCRVETRNTLYCLLTRTNRDEAMHGSWQQQMNRRTRRQLWHGTLDQYHHPSGQRNNNCHDMALHLISRAHRGEKPCAPIGPTPLATRPYKPDSSPSNTE